MTTTENLAIAGTGTIACGLAAVATTVGPVTVLARSEESAEGARAAIAKQAGRLEGGDADRATVTTEQSDLAEATFVVEAIVEDPAHKAALLGRLDGVVGERAILASTTSSLQVAELADASGRPDRFAALHVFNPVPRMALVELCLPEQAAPETGERTRALCEALGKTVVEVPDTPGFVVNKLLFPYCFNAVELQAQTGLDSAAIDTCMTLGVGHPLGPLALLDLVGLDVSAAIGDSIGSPAPQPVHDLIAQGALGRKSGRGFHDYAK